MRHKREENVMMEKREKEKNRKKVKTKKKQHHQPQIFSLSSFLSFPIIVFSFSIFLLYHLIYKGVQGLVRALPPLPRVPSRCSPRSFCAPVVINGGSRIILWLFECPGAAIEAPGTSRLLRLVGAITTKAPSWISGYVRGPAGGGLFKRSCLLVFVLYLFVIV